MAQPPRDGPRQLAGFLSFRGCRLRLSIGFLSVGGCSLRLGVGFLCGGRLVSLGFSR
jgi:hypothetical protein